LNDWDIKSGVLRKKILEAETEKDEELKEEKHGR